MPRMSCLGPLLAALILPGACAWAAPKVVVLDAGHEPSRPGAIGTCGQPEVEYNDAMVAALRKALTGYRLILTREPGREVDASDSTLLRHINAAARADWAKSKALYARPALANAHKADVFLSIHHDSTAARHQVTDTKLCHGQGGKRLTAEFMRRYRVGYNLFVNAEAEEPRRGLALRLARLLGGELRELGRVAANYHVYPADDCKSCRPVAADVGIWHQNLAVLRITTMPAVLIEVGNIIDPGDEARIKTPAFRQAFAQAVKRALDHYFAPPKQARR